MISKNDISLAMTIMQPKILYHLVKLYFNRIRCGNGQSQKSPNHNFLKLKKDITYLRHEKIIKLDNKFIINSFIPPFPSDAFNNFVLRGASWLPGKPIFPGIVDIAITDRCPMNCWHCLRANRTIQGDLTTSEWIRIINELQRINVWYIGFTGGEPLMRLDLEDIIRSIDNRSIVGLGTCGAGLTPERAHSLKRSGLFYIFVSIDNHDPEMHDKSRGYRGAFKIATQGITAARSANLYTVVQTAFSKDMVLSGEFWNILDLTKELGAHELRGGGLRPTGRLINADPNIFLNKQDEDKLREMGQKANKINGYPKVTLWEEFESPALFGCGAGAQNGYIDSGGNVYPCDFVPLGFGNASKEPFTEIWSRVRKAVGMTRRECLAKTIGSYLAKEEDILLPLSPENSKKICESCRSDDVPDYYRR